MYNRERSEYIKNSLMSGSKIKHDCFAYDKDLRRCKALNDLYCMNGECKFYKTPEERCKGCRNAVGKTLTCSDCKSLYLK